MLTKPLLKYYNGIITPGVQEGSQDRSWEVVILSMYSSSGNKLCLNCLYHARRQIWMRIMNDKKRRGDSWHHLESQSGSSLDFLFHCRHRVVMIFKKKLNETQWNEWIMEWLWNGYGVWPGWTGRKQDENWKEQFTQFINLVCTCSSYIMHSFLNVDITLPVHFQFRIQYELDVYKPDVVQTGCMNWKEGKRSHHHQTRNKNGCEGKWKQVNGCERMWSKVN